MLIKASQKDREPFSNQLDRREGSISECDHTFAHWTWVKRLGTM
ncbi:MAG: hypothetical protein BWX48_00040 [Verrucomicrobia bacterium ADurb.Bin006]|nr:MAG: hypothetical protein BWX48_00040 [Verrucomicrobia bacterium ADurb.Bin006]